MLILLNTEVIEKTDYVKFKNYNTETFDFQRFPHICVNKNYEFFLKKLFNYEILSKFAIYIICTIPPHRMKNKSIKCNKNC